MSKLDRLIKEHIGLTAHQDIRDLCKPLFDTLDLCIMNYIRVLPDGKVTYLCDNVHWLKNYLQQHYPSLGAFEQNTEFREEQHVLWSALSDTDPVVIDSREMFNINHGITLVRYHQGAYDFFNFGTNKVEAHAKEMLTSEQERLNQFILEFYDKAQGLITQADQHALDLELFNANTPNKPANKRFYLGPKHNYEYLTQRELDVLQLMLQGFSIPELSARLFISTRTAEKHVENLKTKLNVKTQCQLGFVSAGLGID